MQFAQLLRSAIAAVRIAPPHQSLTFTASIGVALIEPDDSISGAMRRADMALYKAKNEGRNRVQLSLEPVAFTHSAASA